MHVHIVRSVVPCMIQGQGRVVESKRFEEHSRDSLLSHESRRWCEETGGERAEGEGLQGASNSWLPLQQRQPLADDDTG